MKTGKIVDGSAEMKLPSMKRAENVDGSTEMKLPSMKRAVFMDVSENQPGLDVEPLLFIAKFVDGWRTSRRRSSEGPI